MERTSRLEADLPEEERTVFGIRVLTGAQWKAFQLRLETASAAKVVTTGREIVCAALEYVKNHEVINAAGERSPFVLEKAGHDFSDASFQVLQPYLGELLEFVRTAQQVREQDVKN